VTAGHVTDTNSTSPSPPGPGAVEKAAPAPGAVAKTTPPPARTREAPPRPSTGYSNTAPVLVRLTPPFSVRMSQLFWILSFAVGGFTAVFFFIIRKEQLPLISDLVRTVSEGRSDQTYDAAADIVFWIVFGVMVAVLLAQITLLVSFMSRRPHVRWWQLATLGVQVVLLLLSTEWVALGERRESLLLLLAVQAGLVLVALLFSTLPRAIAWSARQHDVRRRSDGVVGAGDL
jgi:hypothetical protein